MGGFVLVWARAVKKSAFSAKLLLLSTFSHLLLSDLDVNMRTASSYRAFLEAVKLFVRLKCTQSRENTMAEANIYICSTK